MSGPTIVAEGVLRTARLTMHHVLTAPPGASAGNVLFLGGSNADLSLKRAFLSSRLAERFTVLTYEPRGIGRTQCPATPWSMADFAADAMAVLDAAGWERALVVGESFGGMTALHLAKAAPHRVRAMVLASTTPGGEGGRSYDIAEFLALPREAAARAALVLQDERNEKLAHTDPAAFGEKLTRRIAFEDAFIAAARGYAPLLDARRGHDAWQALPNIDVPALVVAGSHDRQAPPAAQLAMAEGLANARYAAFPAGHGVLFEDSAASDAVCDFLAAAP